MVHRNLAINSCIALVGTAMNQTLRDSDDHCLLSLPAADNTLLEDSFDTCELGACCHDSL